MLLKKKKNPDGMTISSSILRWGSWGICSIYYAADFPHCKDGLGM